MKRVVYKFPLQITDSQRINLPRPYGNTFNDVWWRMLAFQHGQLCLWAEVRADKPALPCEVIVRGTGHEFPVCQPESYVGSVQDGQFVWHVYARPIGADE